MGWSLGIWDGHDSGAALLENGHIRFLINEERLSKRKLEVHFPRLSIQACLESQGLRSSDIERVSYSTTDPLKTVSRYFPSTKENYYQIRRKKSPPSHSSTFIKRWKYRVSELPPNWFSRALSQRWMRRELDRMGFERSTLYAVDHHDAHIAAAIFTSGFKSGLAVSLDGLGDGNSGSVCVWRDSKIEVKTRLAAADSFGILYEHVTNLLHYRELEDEGKVMALASFATPIADSENRVLELIDRSGGGIRFRFHGWQLREKLEEILWRYPPEQMAYMVQRALEICVPEWIAHWLKSTGERSLVFTGGVASNVKLNGLIRSIPGLDHFYVFPHMGDGGLALGAALLTAHRQQEFVWQQLDELGWGADLNYASIESTFSDFRVTRLNSPELRVESVTAALAKGEPVFFAQGRMEYGPRALGHRSILARADSTDIKDQLNLGLKKRVWFQPFCPVMLESDANEILEDYRGRNPFMTCAFWVKKIARSSVVGALNVDGSCRPQVLLDDDPSLYASVLRGWKRMSGRGVLINTSLNVHGEPLANTVDDLKRAFEETTIRFMLIGDYWIEKNLARESK